jgi:hypothetical protein
MGDVGPDPQPIGSKIIISYPALQITGEEWRTAGDAPLSNPPLRVAPSRLPAARERRLDGANAPFETPARRGTSTQKGETTKLDVLGSKRLKMRRSVKQLTHFRRRESYLIGLFGGSQRWSAMGLSQAPEAYRSAIMRSIFRRRIMGRPLRCDSRQRQSPEPLGMRRSR